MDRGRGHPSEADSGAARDARADGQPAEVADRSRVPDWLERSAQWSWRLLLLAATLYVTAWLLTRLRIVLIPALLSVLGASVLSPMALWLRRRGWSLMLATIAVFAALFLALAAVGAFVTWGFVNELDDPADRVEEVRVEVREWLTDGPLNLDEAQLDEVIDSARDSLSANAGGIGVSTARTILEVGGGAILALLITFFLVKDGETMWFWLLERVDPARRATIDAAGRKSIRTLSAYLGGIAAAGVIDAVFIGIGLALIGVPLVGPLAVITFFAAFFPIVGATVAGALAAVVALVTNGPADALLVVGLTLLVQQVEGNVLLPLIMKRQVRLHPVVVVLALSIGGVLAGIAGAFLAVPLAAVAVDVASVVRSTRGVEPTDAATTGQTPLNPPPEPP